MSRRENAFWIGLFAVTIGTLSFCAYGIYRKEATAPETPCSEFRDTPIRNVPLRCFPTKP